MRISTTVACGSALLLLILIAVLSYNSRAVRQLIETQEDLTRVEFRTATLALEQVRKLDELDEAIWKFFVTEDPGYVERFSELLAQIDQARIELHALELTEPLIAQTAEIDALWVEAPDAWRREMTPAMFDPLPGASAADESVEVEDATAELQEVSAAVVSANTSSGDEMSTGDADAEDSEAELTPRERQLAHHREHLSQLRNRTQALVGASQKSLAQRIEASGRESQQLVEVSAWTLALSVGLAVVVLWLIARGLRSQLARFTHATQALARGDFSHQIEMSPESDFAAVAEEFNTMAKSLAELDQLKRDFVSRVSHDLRTPLVGIQEVNRLLLQELPGPVSDQQRRLLELNVQNGQRLPGMISKLLDVARLESANLEYDFKRRDLRDLIRGSTVSFEPRAREAGLELETQLPEEQAWVLADADRLLQVLDNLLENAIKFTPRDGQITVRVAPVQDLATFAPPRVAGDLPNSRSVLPEPFGRVRSWIVVSVADTGPGVPAAHRFSIFEKFRQLRQVQRSSGQTGVGLGLAICREITAAHHGVLWVDDNPGGGSVFQLALPAAPAMTQARRAPERMRRPVGTALGRATGS